MGHRHQWHKVGTQFISGHRIYELPNFFVMQASSLVMDVAQYMGFNFQAGLVKYSPPRDKEKKFALIAKLPHCEHEPNFTLSQITAAHEHWSVTFTSITHHTLQTSGLKWYRCITVRDSMAPFARPSYHEYQSHSTRRHLSRLCMIQWGCNRISMLAWCEGSHSDALDLPWYHIFNIIS